MPNDYIAPALDASKSQMPEPKVELLCIAWTESDMLSELLDNMGKLKRRSVCSMCTFGSMISFPGKGSVARPLVDIADAVPVDASAEEQVHAGWIRDTGLNGFQPIQVGKTLSSCRCCCHRASSL